MDCSSKSHFTVSRSLVTPKENIGMFDIKPILELLHVNNDVNLQVKLFSTLTAYIMTNKESRDVIIIHNSLYDKICTLLSNCPTRRVNALFNFFSALLYTDDEDSSQRKSLIVYAKNRIRSSGCLAAMSELFTSCMMQQDLWHSLCHCLAETCRGLQANQSYCTHLVPICVQRCSQRNIEVFWVLLSLLQNHENNINLFIKSNGMMLFQREFLQHDFCLQLLNILVQSSCRAVRLIRESDIGQHMRDFLHLYGPQSKIGQWASIILYYISGSKEASEVLTCGNRSVKNKVINETMNKITTYNDNLQCSNETLRLFQNVMNEVRQCGAPSDFKYLQSLFPAPFLNMPSRNEHQVLFLNNDQRNELNKTKHNVTLEYNFTSPQPERDVLIRNESRIKDKPNDFTNDYLQHLNNAEITSNYSRTNKNERLQRKFHNKAINSMRRSNVNESLITHSSRQKTPHITDFKPKFASTPKIIDLNKNSKVKMQSSVNNTRKSVQNSIRKHETKRGIQKKIPKRLQESRVDKENKHRSISGWLFGTINESCTTLVQTVKNIFKPTISLEETKGKSSGAISDKHSTCSFSFTNYMRKRDAILNNDCTKKSYGGFDDFSVELSNSCNTCNDTVALKNKLDNDDYLKQTIRKLKLGINLYGCDFKKISKQLWPQQSYMTPVVLYNLYRKLILK